MTPLELIVIILIGASLLAVAGVIIYTQQRKGADDDAKSSLRAASNAIDKYRQQNGSFVGVSLVRLRKIEPNLPKTLQDPIVAGDSYSLAILSKTGVTYRISHEANGRVTRTCVVPPGGEKGACAANKFGVGTW